jgi:hypothetical protein
MSSGVNDIKKERNRNRGKRRGKEGGKEKERIEKKSKEFRNAAFGSYEVNEYHSFLVRWIDTFVLDYWQLEHQNYRATSGKIARGFTISTTLVSTLPCASIEAGASIEAPFDPLLTTEISSYF